MTTPTAEVVIVCIAVTHGPTQSHGSAKLVCKAVHIEERCEPPHVSETDPTSPLNGIEGMTTTAVLCHRSQQEVAMNVRECLCGA